MKKKVFKILKEPDGQSYLDLLDYALGECVFFLLVTDRDNKQLSLRGKEIMDELFPYLVRMEMKSEWPGTNLRGGKVPVYLYSFVPESAEILKKSATRLYQWQSTELPDDLCLLRSDESPWLVTTAHESDSNLILNEDELQRLRSALPDFSSIQEIAAG